MCTLLYVTCNLGSPQQSRSLSLGQKFLKEYLRCHPEDEVQELDLYRDIVQRTDQDVLNVWRRIVSGEETVAQSDEERLKVGRIWRMADQFSRCEKYVFVTQSLNLWFPAEFKMYVDAICIPERSSARAAQRCMPRHLEPGHKALHLHAGPLSRTDSGKDQSTGYLRSVLEMLGITEQHVVLLDGDNPELGSAVEYQVAWRKLAKLARVF